MVQYWSGDEEGDVYEGDVALPRTGSNGSVDMLWYSVVNTFGPGGLGGPCDEEGDVHEGDVALSRTGSDEMSRSMELLVHPGQVARVAPVMRNMMFMRVMLPCPGPVPTSWHGKPL